MEYYFFNSLNNLKDELLFSELDLVNWKYLSIKYSCSGKSEKAFLSSFLIKFGISKLDELKGNFSIVFFSKKLNSVFLIRDVIGIKPLFYLIKNNNIYFSNTLFKFEGNLSKELNPKKYIEYNFEKKLLIYKSRHLFYKNNYNLVLIEKDNYGIVKNKVKSLFLNSLKRNISFLNKIGVLFSGGTDSTLIAISLKYLGINFKCYTASILGGNIKEGVDIFYARKIANDLNLDWKLVSMNIKDLEFNVKEIISIIGSRNYTKISVALPFYIALKQAKKDGCNVILSGIGSEEIFADYKRNENINDINKVCIEGLESLWERDLYRDYSLSKKLDLELKFPFLDEDFLKYSIWINPKFKIDKKNNINKLVLRDILRDFGLNNDLVSRKKLAAQYGSKSDRAFEKISKKKNLFKQEFLDLL